MWTVLFFTSCITQTNTTRLTNIILYWTVFNKWISVICNCPAVLSFRTQTKTLLKINIWEIWRLKLSGNVNNKKLNCKRITCHNVGKANENKVLFWFSMCKGYTISTRNCFSNLNFCVTIHNHLATICPLVHSHLVTICLTSRWIFNKFVLFCKAEG
jgi:hypothetical protein